MPELNPYAPPADDVAPPRKGKGKSKKSRTRAFREGDHAVVPVDDPRLPKRCVVCNERVSGERIRRTLTWHPQWVYATIFIGALIYVIVAAVTRKSATVEHALCEAHAARRRNGLFLLFGGLAGGLVLMVLGAVSNTGSLVALGSIGMMGCIIAGAIMARTLTPAKIDEHYIRLNVGPPFLESLPHGEDY